MRTSKVASSYSMLDLSWNYLRTLLTLTLILEFRVQSLLYSNDNEVGILKISQTSQKTRCQHSSGL